MKKFSIHIRQFEKGTQGRVFSRGYASREIVTVQLLESAPGLVSGAPKIRVGHFADINGTLREVQLERRDTHPMRKKCYTVTLAGHEELPRENFVPEEE